MFYEPNGTHKKRVRQITIYGIKTKWILFVQFRGSVSALLPFRWEYLDWWTRIGSERFMILLDLAGSRIWQAICFIYLNIVYPESWQGGKLKVLKLEKLPVEGISLFLSDRWNFKLDVKETNLYKFRQKMISDLKTTFKQSTPITNKKVIICWRKTRNPIDKKIRSNLTFGKNYLGKGGKERSKCVAQKR